MNQKDIKNKKVYLELVDEMTEQVANMTDEEFIDEYGADSKLTSSDINELDQIFESAMKQAGKKLLADARKQVDERGNIANFQSSVSADEARQKIAELNSKNNGQLTLAARNPESGSDEDVLRRYENLKALGAFDEEE